MRPSTRFLDVRLKGTKIENRVFKQLLRRGPVFIKKIYRLAGVKRSYGKMWIKNLPEKVSQLASAKIKGKYTSSKADLLVGLGKSYVTISLKGSLSGQVHLMKTDRFIFGMEKMLKKKIPVRVKKGLKLFIGDRSKLFKRRYLSKLEETQHRLSLHTLKRYYPRELIAVMEWFKDNLSKVFLFCFQEGLVAEKKHKAEILLYSHKRVFSLCRERSLFQQNPQTAVLLSRKEIMFSIKKLSQKFKNPTAKTFCYPGEGRSSGTTIQLPFGFLQMHAPRPARGRTDRKVEPVNQMQFHHQLKKIIKWA